LPMEPFARAGRESALSSLSEGLGCAAPGSVIAWAPTSAPRPDRPPARPRGAALQARAAESNRCCRLPSRLGGRCALRFCKATEDASVGAALCCRAGCQRLYTLASADAGLLLWERIRGEHWRHRLYHLSRPRPLPLPLPIRFLPAPLSKRETNAPWGAKQAATQHFHSRRNTTFPLPKKHSHVPRWSLTRVWRQGSARRATRWRWAARSSATR
jgi:hypothetical protein